MPSVTSYYESTKRPSVTFSNEATGRAVREVKQYLDRFSEANVS